MAQPSVDTTAPNPGKFSRAERFVSYVIDRIKKDNGFAARLKRADNPTMEYQSWELLANFSVDLEKEWERLPYCTVGASLAKAKPAANGKLPLGTAIATCFDEGNQSDQAKARLRRLLACTSTSEACRILRPLLALMTSRGVTPDYCQLLEQLLRFSGHRQEQIRARWAQEFYRRAVEVDETASELSHD
ncbi:MULTISPECIES: type I-E CRISPR-associated protein Cse2/CasB [unclassified Serratia (in: enterobacteria)]|uniref:type I-E CRISPR-associated protein Cse2/CasB n=1 Tax=unclassified Serratia (in: enterobacteria) TaxID=2647522 RepID=UPI000505E692|nr:MULTISPECIES: type I-E CRISPR-associated protein Cse2/CasB [unclassified Serratia (in: enterobacteria)]KFK91836.1 CRISPR-associated protein Cse2 [Serratia sp. Ag2]KFK93938.1 CRISPR-associated protein Cse2 [Serratia sp. Ag1]